MKYKLLTLPILIGALSGALCAQTTYFWRGSSSTQWNNLGSWNTASDGSGTTLAEFSAGDTFTSNGRSMVTSSNATTADPFGGAAVGPLSLNLNSTLTVKTLGSGAGRVDNLIAGSGAQIAHGNANTKGSSFIIGGDLDLTASGVTLTNSSTSQAFALRIGALAGSNALTFTGSASGGGTQLTFSNTDQSAATNDFIVSSGKISFKSDLTSGGNLVLDGVFDTTLTGTNTLSFSGLTIGGNAIAAGTYSYGTLVSNFGSFFTGTGTGSITVTTAIPEPASMATVFALGALAFVGIKRKRS